ncbi:MAG: hypothetical protein ACYDG2_26950 [Ruminiclostridium sp.]
MVVILAVTSLTTGVMPFGMIANAASIPVTSVALDTSSWYFASDYFSDLTSAPDGFFTFSLQLTLSHK